LASAAERALERERLRRRRDGLLLELGALVYELHRQGRRQPELLKEKASELAALDAELAGHDEQPGTDSDDARHVEGNSSPKRDEHDAKCPACGEPAEPGQLVCLNCGARLNLGQRSVNPIPALVALIAVVVLGAGAFGFALSELSSGSDDGGEVRVAERQVAPEPEPPPPEPTPRAEETETASGTAQPPKRSLLLKWPEGETAYTVVLVTTSDGPAARRVARGAARSGVTAGLVRSDDFDLGSDLWIVFAGRFDSRQGAVRHAASLADRYPGAYPQLLRPVDA
jgi:hypothetical protein